MKLRNIQFGEIDAKDEVLQQEKDRSAVFMQSFVEPPNSDLKRFERGSKYFIAGAKGSGKTALMYYLKKSFENDNHRTRVVLFKSDLTDIEKQRLITMKDVGFFTDQSKIEGVYDYKQNWLWFIIREALRTIEINDVLEGADVLSDLRTLFGLDKGVSQSITSGLEISRIKAILTAGFKTAVFQSSAKVEIEAAHKATQDNLFEIISVFENIIGRVKVSSLRSYYLFFDELELFMGSSDQRRRDAILIRDLIYAISRLNRKVGAAFPLKIIASIRSEVLSEVNRIGPETERTVLANGFILSWLHQGSLNHHPLLKIIENKIRYSAYEQNIFDLVEGNVWRAMFPTQIDGRDSRQYFADMSMLRPRGVIMLANCAASSDLDSEKFTEQSFMKGLQTFSSLMWTEVEEELLLSFESNQVSAVRSTLSGYRVKFTEDQFTARFTEIMRKKHQGTKSLEYREIASGILKGLYTFGALGQQFKEEDSDGNRDRWSFRGFSEPLPNAPFVVHRSLRKALQLGDNARPKPRT